MIPIVLVQNRMVWFFFPRGRLFLCHFLLYPSLVRSLSYTPLRPSSFVSLMFWDGVVFSLFWEWGGKSAKKDLSDVMCAFPSFFLQDDGNLRIYLSPQVLQTMTMKIFTYIPPLENYYPVLVLVCQKRNYSSTKDLFERSQSKLNASMPRVKISHYDRARHSNVATRLGVMIVHMDLICAQKMDFGSFLHHHPSRSFKNLDTTKKTVLVVVVCTLLLYELVFLLIQSLSARSSIS